MMLSAVFGICGHARETPLSGLQAAFPLSMIDADLAWR
jgi:hypothetical protein